jgi:hypothetical protein
VGFLGHAVGFSGPAQGRISSWCSKKRKKKGGRARCGAHVHGPTWPVGHARPMASGRLLPSPARAREKKKGGRGQCGDSPGGCSDRRSGRGSAAVVQGGRAAAPEQAGASPNAGTGGGFSGEAPGRTTPAAATEGPGR